MTEAMYYILLALLRPGHGYGMMQRIKELSGGRLEMGPGTLYGVLSRMTGNTWQKNTVITLLSRLADKGMLKTSKAGRRNEYIALVTEADYQSAQEPPDRQQQPRDDQQPDIVLPPSAEPLPHQRTEQHLALVTEADYQSAQARTLVSKLYSGSAKGLVATLIQGEMLSQRIFISVNSESETCWCISRPPLCLDYKL